VVGRRGGGLPTSSLLAPWELPLVGVAIFQTRFLLIIFSVGLTNLSYWSIDGYSLSENVT